MSVRVNVCLCVYVRISLNFAPHLFWITEHPFPLFDSSASCNLFCNRSLQLRQQNGNTHPSTHQLRSLLMHATSASESNKKIFMAVAISLVNMAAAFQYRSGGGCSTQVYGPWTPGFINTGVVWRRCLDLWQRWNNLWIPARVTREWNEYDIARWEGVGNMRCWRKKNITWPFAYPFLFSFPYFPQSFYLLNHSSVYSSTCLLSLSIYLLLICLHISIDCFSIHHTTQHEIEHLIKIFIIIFIFYLLHVYS